MTESDVNLTNRGLAALTSGYAPSMAHFEDFIDEVEVSITDAVDSLDQPQTAQLYAEVLDLEQRLDALHDALAVLATSRP